MIKMNPLGFSLNIDKRKTMSTIFVTFIIGISLGGIMWNIGAVYSPYSNLPANADSLNQFSSYEELKTFLETNSISSNYYPYSTKGEWVLTDGLFQAEINAFTPRIDPDFSKTNIQVEGVDEADLVKTDGEYIYLALEDAVIIVKAYPAEDAEVLSRLELDKTINGIFVSGDKLVLFLDVPWFYYANPWDYDILPCETTIQVYDISNRASPTLDRSVIVDGYYFNSRMIDDYVYIIINHPAYLDGGEVDLPTIRSDENIMEIEASTIYYSNYSDAFYSFTNIVAFNIQDPEEAISHKTFLIGAACNLYVSQSNIYIISPRRLEISSKPFSGSLVHKISIQSGEITHLADGFVPGWVLNQFSMDEFGGFFRIATTSGHASRGVLSSMNNVYILDVNMIIIGRLEGLAPGEDLHSARFMGERCYLVTFKKVDPLFVVDLSDPEKPTILGKLKIPGYSDYLHPYDETSLIGVGKETVEADEGDFSWYQGLKISLFDVNTVSKPKELAKYEIGDRGTDSPVLRDHKAFLFSRSKHLLVLPVLVAEINQKEYHGEIPLNTFGEYVFQGVYVIHISLNDGISVMGRISHLNSDDLLKSGYYFESKYAIKRVLYIDNVLYTISDKMIKMNNLDNLSEINNLELS